MSVTLSLFAGAGAQFLDNSGSVLTGGLIYTYAAGTTTPLATYTSNLGTSAHPNPIVLDASGRVPGGEIWLTTGLGYKFVLKDANNVLLGTYDNVPSSAQPPIVNDASSISYEQGYTLTAGAFVIGSTYLITSVGTTNFVAIGATSNTVGVLFIATGVGSGTGTAKFSRTIQNKLQESVSVKDFGAVGDGTTDDTVAIQNAINTCSTNKQTLLFVGGGTYITTQLTMKSNMVIQGDKNTTLKLKASSTKGIFYTDVSLTNIVIDSMIFDGNIANQTVVSGNAFNLDIVRILYASTATITNFNYTNNVFNNITGVLGDVAPIYTGNISNNLINDHYTNCISVNGDNNIISNNIILSNLPNTGTAAWGILINGNNNIVSYNNISLSTGSNITIDNLGIAAGNGNNNQYIFNTINCNNRAKNYCLSTANSSGYNIGTRIIGNIFLNNADYVDMELFSESNIVISGNTHINSKAGIALSSCKNVVISDVNFESRSDNTTTTVIKTLTLPSGADPVNYSISNIYATGTMQSFLYTPKISQLVLDNFICGNCTSYALVIGNNVTTSTNVAISNGVIIDSNQSFIFANINYLNVSNINGRNFTDKSFYQTNCTEVNYANINGTYPQPRSGEREFNGLWNGVLRVGYNYNNTVSGGATVGVKQLKQSLPAGAVVTQVSYQVTQVPTSATNAATIAIGTTSNPNAFLSAAAVTNAKYNTVGYYNGIQTGTPSTFTAFGSTDPLILTIANETLTAGHLEFFIYYTVNPT
jgi:hypothetical protein